MTICYCYFLLPHGAFYTFSLITKAYRLLNITCVLPFYHKQINYKQKNDKESDTTHSKIRIEFQKSKLFNLKTKRMLKIAIVLTCYEKQTKNQPEDK